MIEMEKPKIETLKRAATRPIQSEPLSGDTALPREFPAQVLLSLPGAQ